MLSINKIVFCPPRPSKKLEERDYKFTVFVPHMPTDFRLGSQRKISKSCPIMQLTPLFLDASITIR